MKRLATTLLAAAIGLLTVWLMSGVSSLIDWLVGPYRGCHEFDTCDVPWWVVALFIVWIAGPGVIYACIAYIGIGRRWSPEQWAAMLSVLLLVTSAFYVLWFVYRIFL